MDKLQREFDDEDKKGQDIRITISRKIEIMMKMVEDIEKRMKNIENITRKETFDDYDEMKDL